MIAVHSERLDPTAAPDWVAAALGPGLSDVMRLPWSFTNETWRATTPAGDRYAVTRMASSAAAAFVLRTGPGVARRLGAAGLATPVPIPSQSRVAERVIVSRWLDGTPAMSHLNAPAGAATVGRQLGRVWLRLTAVQTAGLALDETWAGSARLAASASRWLERLGNEVGSSTAAGAARRIEMVAALPDAPSPSFVHGDLVPANLLIRKDDVALLDLEAARIGDAMLDAAWFRWIVEYHHPQLAPVAWSAFAAEAGLRGHDPTEVTRLYAYPVLRILEILAGPALRPAARAGWLEQLERAVARTPPSGAELT